MRSWPVLQILIAVLLLGAAFTSLRWVLANAPASVDPVGEASIASAEADANRRTYIVIESSESVGIKEVLGGEDVVELDPLSPTSYTALILGPVPSISVSGEAGPETIPFALRLEIESDGKPARETRHWIRRPEWTVVVRPDSQ